MSGSGRISEIKTATRAIPMIQKPTLKQRLAQWLLSEKDQINIVNIDEERIDITQSTTIRFEVHNASGGRIVQTRRYDDRKDRNIESLYIITSDKNFGEEIDKILTMEALRA